jgi:hypothetical protein
VVEAELEGGREEGFVGSGKKMGKMKNESCVNFFFFKCLRFKIELYHAFFP